MDQSIHNLAAIYGPEENPQEKSLRRKVFFSVSIAHILFVVAPFVIFGIWEKMHVRKPMPMQVSLVNLVPSGKITDAPPVTPDTPKEEKKDSKKEEKKETPVEEESPVEEPPPPKPVKKEVEKQPEPVKKETVKVPDKPAPVVKTTEKTVDTPKKWEPIKPTEIKKSTTVVKGKNPTPATPKITGLEIAAKLRKIQDQYKSDVVGSSGAGISGLPGGVGVPNGVVPASYYETVSLFLYEQWKQPGKAELKGLKPTVMVHVSVDASGNIKSAKIVRKSNNFPMDSSVEELLSRLKKLPPPPQGAIEMDVTLEIDDN